MWTPEHRVAARRDGQRYSSDLTDAEWALVEPMIPPARRGGRPREVNVREILNGILYVLWTGCQWKALPKDFPPKSTVITISCCGTGMARWNGFTMRFMSPSASRRGARQAQPQRSSTAKAPKRPKKGGLD